MSSNQDQKEEKKEEKKKGRGRLAVKSALGRC